MFTFKMHLAVLLILILFFNGLELKCYDDSYENKERCPHWFTPSSSGILIFVVLEIIYFIVSVSIVTT